MKGISDTSPAVSVSAHNITQINYNIEEIIVETIRGNVTRYEYDYIEIEGELTRAKVIAGLLLVDYDYDSQIAILNNYASDPDDFTEFNTYQAARTVAKTIADSIDY